MLLTLIFFLSLCLFANVTGVQVNYGNPQAFEGDIGLDPQTREIINGKLSPQAFKGVFQNRIWPGGVIPYVFDRNFGTKREGLMLRAFEKYKEKTCIKFVPRNNQRDYVLMVNQNACWSIIGRGGGRQLLKMGAHCLQSGTAIHELMHAAGFYHEQSRYDRDTYVNIFWNNIQSGESYNFQKYRSNYYGQSYDLNSIMHYRNTEFGAWGRTTIEAKNNRGLKLGNSYFSETDINAINRMYGCGNSGGINPPPVGGNCKDNDNNCRFWAGRGECNRNPNYMSVNCRAACGKCQY